MITANLSGNRHYSKNKTNKQEGSDHYTAESSPLDLFSSTTITPTFFYAKYRVISKNKRKPDSMLVS